MSLKNKIYLMPMRRLQILEEPILQINVMY